MTPGMKEDLSHDTGGEGGLTLGGVADHHAPGNPTENSNTLWE